MIVLRITKRIKLYNEMQIYFVIVLSIFEATFYMFRTKASKTLVRP